MSNGFADGVEIATLLDKNAKIPEYGSASSSGADVRAFLDGDMVLPPGQSALVPTGLRFAIPEGYEIQVRPRSGLALKHQITVLNTPGTIDADYRGEVKVILINHGKENFVIQPGMRIAQLIVAPVTRAKFVNADELVGTSRGTGGFGHTGFF